VQGACQGCCETVRGVEESLRSRGVSRNRLNECGCYGPQGTKEYLAHIVAVLRIIDQKGLPKKCRMLAKAVVKWSEVLKNLLEAAGSQDTVLANVYVQARKVEIEQTQQILQESQKAHHKAIAKTYKQLRNLLSGDAQSQWDPVCREMHSMTCGLQ
jgi:hypothetical protein